MQQSFDNVPTQMLQSAIIVGNERASNPEALAFQSCRDYKTYKKELAYMATEGVQLAQPKKLKAFHQEIQEPHVCWDCKTKQACLDYAPPKDARCTYEKANPVMNMDSLALKSESVKRKEQLLDHPPPLCSLGAIENQDGSFHDIMVNDEQFPFGLLRAMEAIAPCDTTYQTNQQSFDYVHNKMMGRDKVPICDLNCMCCNCKAKQESVDNSLRRVVEIPHEAKADHHKLPLVDSSSVCWDCKSKQGNTIHFPKKAVEFPQKNKHQEFLSYDGNYKCSNLKTKQEKSGHFLETREGFPQDMKRMPFLDKDGMCQDCNRKRVGFSQASKEVVNFLQETVDPQEVDHYRMQCWDGKLKQREYDHSFSMEMECGQLDVEVDQQEAPLYDPNEMCMDCNTKQESLSQFLKEVHSSPREPEVNHYEVPNLENTLCDFSTNPKEITHMSKKEAESLHVETTKIFRINIPPLHRLESRTWDPKMMRGNELLSDAMSNQIDSSRVQNAIHPNCLSKKAELSITSLIEPPQIISKHHLSQTTDVVLDIPKINEASLTRNEILDKMKFEKKTNTSALLYELATLEISNNKDVHQEHAGVLIMRKNGVDTSQDEKGTLDDMSQVTSLEVDHVPSTRCGNAKLILEKQTHELAREKTHVEEITCQGDALHALNKELTTIFKLKLEAYKALRAEVKALAAKMQDNDDSFLEQEKKKKEKQTRLLQIELGEMQKVHNDVQRKLDLSNCLLVEVSIGVDNLQLEKEKANRELDRLKGEGGPVCKTQLTFQIPETIRHVSLGVEDDLELSRAMKTMIQIQQARVRKGISAQVETNIEEAPLACINLASLPNGVAFQDDNVVTSEHEVGTSETQKENGLTLLAMPNNINGGCHVQNVAPQSTSTPILTESMAIETCCNHKETTDMENVQETRELADDDVLQWLQKNAHEDGNNIKRLTKVLALAYSYDSNATTKIDCAAGEAESTYSEDWIEETPEFASPPNPPHCSYEDKISSRITDAREIIADDGCTPVCGSSHQILESECVAQPVKKVYQTCSIHGIDLKNAVVISPPKRFSSRPVKETTHHHHQRRVQQVGDLLDVAAMMEKHGYKKIRPFHQQFNGPKVTTIEHSRLSPGSNEHPPLLSLEGKVLETYKALGEGKQQHLNEFDANMVLVKKHSELSTKSRFNKIKDPDLHKMVDDIMILKSEETSLLHVLRCV